MPAQDDRHHGRDRRPHQREAIIDADALAGLATERIDWRFKGMPADAAGMTVAELAGQRRGLFDGGFHPPLVVLDAAALEHNLTTMARWCADRGVLLAPHGKTTMAPQLYARQLEHGACGITIATFGQLRVCRAFGVRRVLLANQLLDPAGLGWLAAELDRHPGFEFSCFVDSVAGVEQMAAALRAAGSGRRVDVLVELGGVGGRTGVRDEATAIAVAEAVAKEPVLRLTGTAGYEAALAHDVSAAGLAKVEGYLRALRSLTERFVAQGRFETDEVIMTAGGSAYFDQVAELAAGLDGITVVLRSGAYVTHDDGFYAGISPLGRGGGPVPFQNAMHAWAQVTSRPEPGLALLTMGRRDVSFDQGLPVPREVRRRDGSRSPISDATITQLNDQHAFLSMEPGTRLDVGDLVRSGPSHPCTVFDKWQLLPVVEGETVVDFVRTFF